MIYRTILKSQEEKGSNQRGEATSVFLFSAIGPRARVHIEKSHWDRILKSDR